MKKMSRRDLIKGMGAMGALALAGPLASCVTAVSKATPSSGPNSSPVATPNLSPDCVLTPEQVEGPYYIKTSDLRSDIRESKSGAETRLLLTVINASSCQPIPNATVDVWHADASGLYSAYPGQGDSRNIDTSDQDFLRGIQVTNTSGEASFTTIWPGWYPGRTTHIHFKIHFRDQTRVTSQLYLPEELSRQIFTSHAAYTARGDQDTPNASDSIWRQSANPERLQLKVSKQGDVYLAALTLGIAVS